MTQYTNRKLAKHSLVGRMAEELKAAYTAERRLWKGSRNGEQEAYKPPAKLDESWRRFAELMLAENIFDCRAFTRLQFKIRSQSALCPEPKACYGPAAVARWRRFCADSDGETIKEIRLALRLNLSQYQVSLRQAQYLGTMCNWTETEAIRHVLMDKGTPMSALFRYCYAAKHELADIADYFFDAALYDYLYDRQHYDEIWADAISSELRSVADDICAVAKHAVKTYGGK